jgi:transcriptional regulator with XRE-family HTH domain
MIAREKLATNMRRLRREQGLSQEELAHRSGIDRTYVSALERCIYSASLDVLDKLAIAFSVDVSELLVSRRMKGGR